MHCARGLRVQHCVASHARVIIAHGRSDGIFHLTDGPKGQGGCAIFMKGSSLDAPRSSIICQAHPRRVARVSKQLEREVSNLLQTDKVFEEVLSSGSDTGLRSARGRAVAGHPITTCNGVWVSADLQVIKVYLYVYTKNLAARSRIMSRMQGLTKYMRRRLGERVPLRRTPEVRILHDDAVDRGEDVLALLDEIEEEEKMEEAAARGVDLRAQRAAEVEAAAKAEREMQEGEDFLWVDADSDDSDAEDVEVFSESDEEYSSDEELSEEGEAGDGTGSEDEGGRGRVGVATVGDAGKQGSEEEEEEEGFLDLETLGYVDVSAKVDKAKPKNIFMEGVGDPRYDFRVGPGRRKSTVFTKDMFPDAYQEEDEIEIELRQQAWRDKQGKASQERSKRLAKKRR